MGYNDSSRGSYGNRNRNYNTRNSDNRFGNGNSNDVKVINPFVDLTEENYVELAEKAIDAIGENKDKNGKPKVLTPSKIRNILSLNAEIYNDVINDSAEQLSEEIRGRINYLKVRVIYEAGRELTVKTFVNEAHLLENLNGIKGIKKQYLLFSRYLEALVAYRKFKYGNDEN